MDKPVNNKGEQCYKWAGNTQRETQLSQSFAWLAQFFSVLCLN